jgi:hypothetical protein
MVYRVRRPHVEQPADLTIRHVALTKNQVAVVDAADYELVNAFNWTASFCKATGTYYAIRVVKHPDGRKEVIAMHRFLTQASDARIVDHRDGDTLRNVRINLRPTNKSGNAANARRSAANKTGFKGVYYDAARRSYQASIGVSGRQIHLGRFGDPTSAARAYDVAAIQHHGQFAKTNFNMEEKTWQNL